MDIFRHFNWLLGNKAVNVRRPPRTGVTETVDCQKVIREIQWHRGTPVDRPRKVFLRTETARYKTKSGYNYSENKFRKRSIFSRQIDDNLFFENFVYGLVSRHERRCSQIDIYNYTLTYCAFIVRNYAFTSKIMAIYLI